MQSLSSRLYKLKQSNASSGSHVAGFAFAPNSHNECSDSHDACHGGVAEVPSLDSSEMTPLRRNEYCKETQGNLNETLNLPTSQLDYSALASLVGECARQKTLSEGRKLHSNIICSSLEKKVLLCNLLIKFYDACGQPMDAHAVFDRMQSRNVITWTLIMNAHIHHGDHTGAINRYREMHDACVKPNSITLVSILAATSLDQGKTIHACGVEYGFDTDVILQTALINMYRKCGCLENLRWLFDRMGSRDVIAWNTIIAAYVHHGQMRDSIQLYLQMQHNNVKPNHVSFVTMLGTCCNPAATLQALILHASIVEGGFEADVAIGAALVTAYSKCKRGDDAYNVFQKVRIRNVIMWNAMISAYVESGQESRALCVYEEMKAQETLNHVTLITVLSACTALTSVLHGMDVHATAVSHNLESHNSLGTALINMYGKCGNIKSARRVFNKLSLRDLVTWNAMLFVYVLNELVKEAFQFYQQMLVNKMIPDRYTFNTLLGACHRPGLLMQGHILHNDILAYGMERQAGVGVGLVGMYNRCGGVEAARKAFEQQDMHDLDLCNTMLSGYVQNNLGKEALSLYQKMGENGVEPDEFTFSAVTGACADLAALEQGKEVHAALVDGGFDSDGAVKNALVHMYCRCGNMADAWSVFKTHHDHDAISWNAMVSGCAQHGYGNEALQVYQRMRKRNIKVNKVTYVSVFSACAHVGLVEEGLEFLDSMRKVHGFVPDLEHYASIVDLFGKVGRIEEAENFVGQFPVQPDVVVWKVMLGSCKVHNDGTRGKDAAKHAVELDLENSLSYAVLSNFYAAYEDLGSI